MPQVSRDRSGQLPLLLPLKVCELRAHSLRQAFEILQFPIQRITTARQLLCCVAKSLNKKLLLHRFAVFLSLLKALLKDRGEDKDTKQLLSSRVEGGRILKKRNLVFPTVLKQQLIFTSFRGKFVEHPCDT